MFLYFFLFLNFFNLFFCRIILPTVPDYLQPPIPDAVNLTSAGQLMETDPELTPGLFQGDMAMDNLMHKNWRIGLRWDIFPDRIWTNRTVPYAISPLYEQDDQITIYQAIRTLNFMTCVNFIPWNGKIKDFLLIWPIKYPAGCWSYIGKIGGAQIVSLQPPDSNGPNCLGGEGRALHELMHALGIFHEQSRDDRDRFVKVHWENIIPGFRDNFEKQSKKNTSYGFEYDYESIMHYGTSGFSRERGKPTLTAKISGKKIGQRKSLSKTDCLKINELYGCLDDSNSKISKKYYTLCRVLGI